MSGSGNKTMQAGRRRFLVDLARTAGGVALLGLGVGLYARQAASLPAQALRPPGALPEANFLGACIRCGLCVRDCPYDTLKLAEPGSEVATGTPYFIARDVPCEMCEDIPCIKACPTNCLTFGARDDLLKIADERASELRAGGQANAGVYNPPGVGGTNVCVIAAPAAIAKMYFK